MFRLIYCSTANFDIDEDSFCQKTRATTMGDMTFEEAYKKTGRILNITVTSSIKHGEAITLNYITSPNVVIWSAVVASSAIPPLIKPAHYS